MAWKIHPKKMTVGGNAVEVTPLSRREGDEFRAKMSAADGDEAATNALVCELGAGHVKIGDGEPVDPLDVPNGDLMALFRAVLGVDEAGSVADFTPRA